MNQIKPNQVNYYYCTENDQEQRLDNLLIKLLKGVPKTHLYRIIRNGEVRVNKARASANLKLKLNDIIRIPPLTLAARKELNPPKLTNFNSLFEDDYYLIINKPSGIACHGGSGISFGVIEELRFKLKPKFLELAHRLDRDTSGILILAKKRTALVQIQELMQNNQMLKEYQALTLGKWDDNKTEVKLKLTKYTTAQGERRVRVDPKEGLYSHTIFKVLQTYSEYTLVQAILKTGRTHQIRVHAQSIGHPIIADEKYGNYDLNKQVAKQGLKRLFLHAYHIKFTHPITHEVIDLTCPLDSKLDTFLTKI